MAQSSQPASREGTSAILLSSDGRLLFQQRDNIPHVSDPGMISLFGGRREGTETFLQCVVREVHEEIGYYLPPERFELIGSYFGPDHFVLNGTLRGEVFVARGVPIERLRVTEGNLKIVAVTGLDQIYNSLAVPAQYAIELLKLHQPNLFEC